MIGAKVVLSSLHPQDRGPDQRITTLIATVPHIILPQMNTHRVFSRNVGSSRAKPFKVLKEAASRENRFVPRKFGKNQPGMQSYTFFEGADHDRAEAAWHHATESAIQCAEAMNDIGVHKQICNRLLEPFIYVDMLITSSEWENFFQLRAHHAAQPEIEDVAIAIKKAIDTSEPQVLRLGEWHIPFVTEQERSRYDLKTLLKISTARNARISYKTFDGKISTLDKDLELYESLVGSHPKHMSPTEHIAQAVDIKSQWIPDFGGMLNLGRMKSNLGSCWLQYRKLVEMGIV